MVSIAQVVLSQQWLLGGVLAVMGATLASLGLMFQKVAIYGIASALTPADAKFLVAPSWQLIRTKKTFWFGVLLFMVHTPVYALALRYAPETTVAPLGAFQVLVNFVLAYGFLNERFTRSDLTGSVVCIASAAVMNLAMPSNLPGHMDNFPYLEALSFAQGLTSNTGFAAYLLVWLALLAICLVLLTFIFLPVLNYAPEGENFVETLQARWTQAKRHALGISELVYYHDHFHRILCSADGSWGKVMFMWRGFFLWFKLLMIHLVMATLWVIGPINGLLIAWFVRHEKPQDLNINSWTFLVNCVCQSVSFLSFQALFLVSVVMYEAVKERVDGSQDPQLSIRWRSRVFHGVCVLVQSMLYMPIFMTLAAAAEWIAAIKTARTHVFDYEVALKPNLSKETTGLQNRAA